MTDVHKSQATQNILIWTCALMHWQAYIGTVPDCCFVHVQLPALFE